MQTYLNYYPFFFHVENDALTNSTIVPKVSVSLGLQIADFSDFSTKSEENVLVVDSGVLPGLPEKVPPHFKVPFMGPTRWL